MVSPSTYIGAGTSVGCMVVMAVVGVSLTSVGCGGGSGC